MSTVRTRPWAGSDVIRPSGVSEAATVRSTGDTHHLMSVPGRDLRNKSAALVKRVQQSERVVVTKDGDPVAEVVPLRRAPLHRDQLLQRWATLPRIDAEQFNKDVDDMLDWSL